MIRPMRPNESRIKYIQEQRKNGFTYEEIGQELDVTRDRVSQIFKEHSTETKHLKIRYLKQKKYLKYAQNIMKSAIERVTHEDFVKFVKKETKKKYTEEQIKQLLINGETLDGIVGNDT